MAGSQLPKTPLPILLSLGDIPDPGKSVNNGELGRKTVATLSLVAGAVPPPRDPKHSGRGRIAFWLFPSRLSLENSSVCPPSLPAAAPTPPKDLCFGVPVDWERGKQRALGPPRAGWDGPTAGAGGACAAKHQLKAGQAEETAHGCRFCPVWLFWSRISKPWVWSVQSGPGSTQRAPLRGQQESRAGPPPPVNSDRRPIRARLAGREAARGFYCGAGGAPAARMVSGCSSLTA